MTMTYKERRKYNTWNVWHCLNNDTFLYESAVEFMKKYKGSRPYGHFIASMGMNDEKTTDGVKWQQKRLNYDELNKAMNELKGEQQ